MKVQKAHVIGVTSVILICGIIWVYIQNLNLKQETVSVDVQGMVAESVIDMPSDAVCEESDKYFAITRYRQDGNGTETVIKSKIPGTIIPCKYSISITDFIIRENYANDQVWMFIDDLVVIDSGTSPSPRIVRIYDLLSRVEVFRDVYYGPLELNGDQIIYWKSLHEAKKAECENVPYYADGFMYLESQVALNLNNFERRDLGVSRCSYQE